MRSLKAVPRRIVRVMEIAGAALKEIFDESAYARFLARESLESSREAYARFLRESELMRARRARCC